MFGVIALFLMAAKLIIGVGLAWNCARGLFSGEGKYDQESSSIMMWSQILGIGLGVFLVANAFGFVHIPFVPFF